MQTQRTLSVLAAAVLAMAATLARAETDRDAAPDEDDAAEAPPLWTAGLFAVAGHHAVYPGAARRTTSAALLPFITYRGPLLRLESGNAGLRAMRTPRAELDFSASASFGSGGRDTGAREGMPAVGKLAEIGPSLRINLGELREDGQRPPGRLDLPVRLVFDVDRDLRYTGVSFEPRLSLRLADWSGWTPSVYVGALFGSRGLNDMYYGVDPIYVTPARPAYTAKAGLVATRLGMSISGRLREDLRLGLHAGMESVRGAANENSPLVGRMVDPSVAITLTWTALRSESPGVR
jgi:outer membrane scaffolding protein for murein synthesis (MipA/OmpV family)